MAYPDEFISENRLGYRLGRQLVVIGHIAVTCCVLAFITLMAIGNSNAGLSGVPLGLSLCFYFWGNVLIAASHTNWQRKKRTQLQGVAPLAEPSWAQRNKKMFQAFLAAATGLLVLAILSLFVRP